MWPWEQFDWGVFWAVAAVLLIRGFFHWIGALFDRLMKFVETKTENK
jgi:hypothetical protein